MHHQFLRFGLSALCLTIGMGYFTATAQAADGPAANPTDDKVKQPHGLSYRKSRHGYTDSNPEFGGPTSPEGDLEEADEEKDPAFRFPEIDEAFAPWARWKEKQNKDHGFQLSAHYSSMFQGISDAVAGGDDMASAAVLRSTLKWTPQVNNGSDAGSLLVTLDYRHAIRDTAPADLAGQAGYIGITSLFYNDMRFAVINLNWQQPFNDRDTGLIVGRYDPNDYMNVLGYVNPWSIFSNLAINLDTSVALPDSSWGIGAGHWLNDNWYVIGGINDANGVGSDDLEFFEGGAEFFTFAHVGWSPSKADRYFKNVHVMTWHADEREDLGIPSSHGVTLAANWTINDRWMPFARVGFSQGDAPIYNDSLTLGLIRKFLYRSDLIGVAFNYGESPNSSLDEQTTVEAFWRIQFSQNLEITPSVQWLLDPALNDDADDVWAYGLRLRLTF